MGLRVGGKVGGFVGLRVGGKVGGRVGLRVVGRLVGGKVGAWVGTAALPVPSEPLDEGVARVNAEAGPKQLEEEPFAMTM